MIINLAIEVENDVEPEYLVDVIMWGIEKHNGAVTPAAEVHGDYHIDPLSITVEDE